MIKKQKLVRILEKIRNGTSWAFTAFLIQPYPIHSHFLENKLKKARTVTFVVFPIIGWNGKKNHQKQI